MRDQKRDTTRRWRPDEPFFRSGTGVNSHRREPGGRQPPRRRWPIELSDSGSTQAGRSFSPRPLTGRYRQWPFPGETARTISRSRPVFHRRLARQGGQGWRRPGEATALAARSVLDGPAARGDAEDRTGQAVMPAARWHRPRGIVSTDDNGTFFLRIGRRAPDRRDYSLAGSKIHVRYGETHEIGTPYAVNRRGPQCHVQTGESLRQFEPPAQEPDRPVTRRA